MGGPLDNDNDFVLPPDISPEAREYFKRYKAVAEKFIAQVNSKPFGWETVEAQDQMREEIMKIAASFYERNTPFKTTSFRMQA